MNKYVDYLDSISVDAELHERTMNRLRQKPVPRYKKRVVRRYAGLAVCLAVVLICAHAVPALTSSPVEDIPYNPGEIVTEPLFTGLPVDNFNLADMQFEIHMDRPLYTRLYDFFSYCPPKMFVLARVIETEQYRDDSVRKQDATVSILSTVWSLDDDIPETITLTQWIYGGCVWTVEGDVLVGSEIRNLLREGGVYLLPLEYWQDRDMWTVTGDLDVLFEVDDKSLIWTHSGFEGFSRFDGENVNVLINAITAFTSDENCSVAITSFGRISWNWGVLAETTVLSMVQTTNRYGYDQYQYTVSTDSILSVAPNDYYQWRPDKDSFTAISYASGYLEQGGRYLILLDPSEDGPYIEPGRVAKINDDGTITAITAEYGNVFDEFNGYTVEQMKELAERAIAWHERHAR